MLPDHGRAVMNLAYSNPDEPELKIYNRYKIVKLSQYIFLAQKTQK